MRDDRPQEVAEIVRDVPRPVSRPAEPAIDRLTPKLQGSRVDDLTDLEPARDHGGALERCAVQRHAPQRGPSDGPAGDETLAVVAGTRPCNPLPHENDA